MSDLDSGAPEAETFYRRIVADLADQARLRAGQVVQGPPGLRGTFDSDWPASHMSNRVLVDAALPLDVDAAAVLAFVDEVFAGRCLDHRKVDVLDDIVGQRLAPGLADAGYEASPVLVMVAGPTAVRTPGVVVVETVDEGAVASLVEKGWWLEAPDFSAETVRQLVGRRAAAERAGTLTRLAVRDPATGALVAKTDLLLRGQLAEVDDVLTLPDHRGRGYASALVLDAVDRARSAGVELIYLQAAEDDWPQHLYTRLGFETFGRIHEHSLTDLPR